MTSKKDTGLRQTTSSYFSQHVILATVDGEINDIHPFAFFAGGLGPNSNILSYGEAMSIGDTYLFEESMEEEIICLQPNLQNSKKIHST